MPVELELQAFAKREMRFLPDVKVDFSFDPPKGHFDIERNPHETPIIINNFNRLTYLRQMVESLRVRGYENIYVIDNASTYEPLLDYYRTEHLRVFYLDTNVGYLALWRTHVRHYFERYHYVYSDPDILPIEECPADFMAVFYAIMMSVPEVAKVGFGLNIDDIPDHYPLREDVLQNERRFWTRPLDQNRMVYAAPIDTTFALYKPKAAGGFWLPAIRTAGPYLARHLPWYEDPAQETAELAFYRSAIATRTHWTSLGEQIVDAWPPEDDLVPWGRESAFWSQSGGAQVLPR